MQRLVALWRNQLNSDKAFAAESPSSGGGKVGWVLAAVLGLAVLLRAVQYIACRSLWLDEASMGFNFFDRGFGKLLHPFENHQSAPIGFNVLTELVLQFARISERSLRFIPLLFGLASVYAFWRVSRRWLSGPSLIFANYAFAISSTLIYYSNEFKPYIIDVFVGLILAFGIVSWWEGGRPRKLLIWIGVGGCIAIWLSFPIVFVMAGSGSVVLLACLRERKYREFLGFSLVVCVWLIAFGINYYFFARHIAQMDDLTDYWRGTGGFMPFPPWKGGGITWFTGTFFNYFNEVAGLHNSRNILQFIFLCGVVELARRGALVRLGVLLAPIVVTIVVSATERYPFQGRLALFTVPFALLICGDGMRILLDRLRQPLLCWALIVIALFSPTAYTLPLLWRPTKVEEVRPLAEHLRREVDPQEPVFVFKDNSSFAFYRRFLDLKHAAIPFGKTEIAEGGSRIARELQGGRRCWLVVSHATEAEQAAVLAHLQSVGRLRVAREEVGASLYAIEPLGSTSGP